MKKYQQETETKVVYLVSKIFCNKCGNEICGGYNTDHVDIQKLWGYGSKKDMIQQQADICEPCWDAFCASFTIPVADYDPYDMYPPDTCQLSFDFYSSGEPHGSQLQRTDRED